MGNYYRILHLKAGLMAGAPVAILGILAAAPALAVPVPPDVSVASGAHRVTLSWTLASASGGAPVSAYYVYRSTGPSGPFSRMHRFWAPVTLGFGDGTQTMYHDGTASPAYGQTYHYLVSIVDDTGASAFSSSAQGTPTRQNWPRFRGDAYLTGNTPANVPNRLEMMWRGQMPTGVLARGQIYYDGRVYLSASDGYLRNYDAHSGVAGTARDLLEGVPPNDKDGIYISPMAGPNGVIYCANMMGAGTGQAGLFGFRSGASLDPLGSKLMAADSTKENVYLNLAFTGNSRVLVGVQDGMVWGWDSNLLSPDSYWQQDVGFNQRGGAATLMNGNLVFALSYLSGCNLVCYTPEGELVWTRTLQGWAAQDPWNSPVAVGQDGRVYAAFGSEGSGGQLVALKSDDGSDIWNYPLTATRTGLAVSLNGDAILTMSGTVYCIAADKALRWQTTIPATASAPALVTGNGKVLVAYQDWPSGASAAEYRKGIVMLRETDGALLWNWRSTVEKTAALRDLAATPDGWFYVSIDDGLYAFTVPPVLELAKRVSATSAFPGDPVTYTLSWTNSSTMTAPNFSVYDTLPAGASYEGGSFFKRVPAGTTVSMFFGPSINGPYTAGEPLTGAGATGTLLLRWDIAPVGAFATGELGFSVRISSTLSAGAIVTNRASGTYFFGSTTTLVESGLVSTTVILPPPPPTGLKIEKSVDPADPVIGGPVKYRIVVTNSGAATIETLTVTDTLPVEIVNASAEQPTAFSAPAVTPLGSATIYAWSRTGLSMLPGTVFTFTISGQAAEVCALAEISNTAYALGVSPTGATEGVSAALFTAYPADLEVTVLKIQAPASGTVLTDWAGISYQIVVTNAGTATVTGLTVRDTVSPVIGSVSTAASSVMGPVSATDVAGGTLFEWSQPSLSMAPGLSFTFTISGVVQVLCEPASISNSAWIAAASECGTAEVGSNQVHFTLPEPGTLSGTGWAPPLAGVGQAFEVRLTVTNTGSRDVTSVLPQLAVEPGEGFVTVSPSAVPSGPVDLAPGAAQTFRWSVTATGAGLVSFTLSGAGLTCASTAPALSAVTVSTTIQTAAVLKAVAHISATMVATNQLVYLTLSVTNSGGADINNFALSPVALSSTSFTLLNGPTPSVPSVLPPISYICFTWTYRATGPGESTFMVIASGKDANIGTDLVVGDTEGPINVYREANLLGSVWLSGTSLIVGDVLTVTFTVTNSGEVVALSVTPTLNLDGTGTYAFLSVPAAVTIPDAGRATFTWTLSAVGRGTLGVAASGLGLSVLSAAPVSTGSVSAASSLIFLERGGIEITSFAMSPPNVTLGENISALLNLRNPGDIEVTVTAAVGAAVPPGVLSLTTNPNLEAVLPAGGTQTFTWEYSTQNCGGVAVSVDVSGTDERGTVPAAQTAAQATVLGEPVLLTGKATPAAARVGGLAELEFHVTDSCGQPVPAVSVNLAVIVPPDAALVPAQGTTDAAGAFASRLVLGSVPGLNVVRGEVLGGTNPSATIQVEGGMPDAPVSYLSRNFFNPERGERLRIKLIVPAAMDVRVRIHNLAGELVRNLNHAVLPAGLTFWEWDGRNDSGQTVGSGTYFIQISSGEDSQLKRVIVIRQ